MIAILRLFQRAFTCDNIKTTLSGIQPSGSLHLGNYFGSIVTMLQRQDINDERKIFSIADLHSMTVQVERISQIALARL